ncbi:MAG: hypothetical protein JO164_08145 [Candidatus Eremiobacteraeota bacterium]|nr:hypothetical protein [Candidatus Eremiobacteraeota bacterium]
MIVGISPGRVAALAAAALVSLALGMPQRAGAQSMGMRPTCDGHDGATIVGRTPITSAPATMVMILVYPAGQVGDDYVEALRATLAPPHVTTVDEFKSYQAKQQRLAYALPTFFAQARVARPDDHGTIACGGLPAGRYDVLVGATGGAPVSGAPPMKYFLAHANVPPVTHGRVLVPMSAFAAVLPSQ